MAERGALRQPGRPTRVLDVHGVARIQVGRALGERLVIDAVALGEQSLPPGGVEHDDPLDPRQLATHLVDHRYVVAGLERLRTHEHPAAGLPHCEHELVRAVGRVEVHEHDPCARGRVLDEHPLDAVGAPQAEPVAAPQSDRQERLREPVDLRVELGVCQPHTVLARHDRRPLRHTCRGASEVLADRAAEERDGRGAVCVGGSWHGDRECRVFPPAPSVLAALLRTYRTEEQHERAIRRANVNVDRFELMIRRRRISPRSIREAVTHSRGGGWSGGRRRLEAQNTSPEQGLHVMGAAGFEPATSRV